MGFLRSNDNAKPDYTALQLQTSTSILPIPIVWGQNKISVNVLWYANFQAVAGGSGKGIGGKGGLLGGGTAAGADYTYTADIILGLCEGPINGIGLIWKDLSIYAPLELGLGTEYGTTPQAVWSYLAEIYPYNALAYQGTAYFWGEGYNLGDSASIGNHNVEVIGVLSGSGANGIDADPSEVINDFLTNAQYGCGFNPASIDSGALFTNAETRPKPIAGQWASLSPRPWSARNRHRAFLPAGCSFSIAPRYGAAGCSSSFPMATPRSPRGRRRPIRRSFQSRYPFPARRE